MIRALSFACVLASLSAPSLAEYGVAVTGLLPDQAFFTAATCGTPQPEDCHETPPRWPRTDLTLAVLPDDLPTSRIFDRLLSVTVDYALLQINSAGSALRITRVAGPKADITLRRTDLPEGAPLPDQPGLTAAGIMGVGYTSLWWDDQRRITDASILISANIAPADVVSVVLEEVFQATGPLFDIEGPAYEGVSILSQSSNATVTIAGQDARLLRWLYPPQNQGRP